MMRRSENENAMKKKNEKRPEGELRSEYDPSKLKGGVRGKYILRAIERERTLYCCRRMSLSISPLVTLNKRLFSASSVTSHS